MINLLILQQFLLMISMHTINNLMLLLQVELYTHHQSLQKIVSVMVKSGFSLSAVHLVDSHYCCDPGKFVSVLLTSLSTMLQSMYIICVISFLVFKLIFVYLFRVAALQESFIINNHIINILLKK